jgi:hypothetical protein
MEIRNTSFAYAQEQNFPVTFADFIAGQESLEDAEYGCKFCVHWKEANVDAGFVSMCIYTEDFEKRVAYQVGLRISPACLMLKVVVVCVIRCTQIILTT